MYNVHEYVCILYNVFVLFSWIVGVFIFSTGIDCYEVKYTCLI